MTLFHDLNRHKRYALLAILLILVSLLMRANVAFAAFPFRAPPSPIPKSSTIHLTINVISIVVEARPSNADPFVVIRWVDISNPRSLHQWRYRQGEPLIQEVLRYREGVYCLTLVVPKTANPPPPTPVSVKGGKCRTPGVPPQPSTPGPTARTRDGPLG